MSRCRRREGRHWHRGAGSLLFDGHLLPRLPKTPFLSFFLFSFLRSFASLPMPLHTFYLVPHSVSFLKIGNFRCCFLYARTSVSIPEAIWRLDPADQQTLLRHTLGPQSTSRLRSCRTSPRSCPGLSDVRPPNGTVSPARVGVFRT